MCKLSVSEREREGEREYVLSVHNKRNLWQKHGYNLSIVYLKCICLASVVVDFGSFAVLGCKDL